MGHVQEEGEEEREREREKERKERRVGRTAAIQIWGNESFMPYLDKMCCDKYFSQIGSRCQSFLSNYKSEEYSVLPVRLLSREPDDMDVIPNVSSGDGKRSVSYACDCVIKEEIVRCLKQ